MTSVLVTYLTNEHPHYISTFCWKEQLFYSEISHSRQKHTAAEALRKLRPRFLKQIFNNFLTKRYPLENILVRMNALKEQC